MAKFNSGFLIPVLALLLTSACGGKQEKPEPEGYFATQIDANGDKLFQYSLDIQGSGGGGPGNVGGHVAGTSSRGVSGGVTAGTGTRKGRSRSGGKGGSNRFTELNAKLENRLEKELKSTGYCREGYQETERMTGPSAFFIKGKCSETATDDDRKQFSEGA